MAKAWRTYVVAGLVLAVVIALLPQSAARDVTVTAVGVVAVAALLLGIRVHRPDAARAWLLLALGLALWVAGDATWMWITHVQGRDAFPSGADAVYLSAYPALFLALHLLARRRVPGGDRSALLDALIVAVAVTLVLWAGFIEPTWTAADGTTFERVVAVAYPVCDVVLLTQMFHLSTSRARPSGPLVLLAAGTTVVLVADLVFQTMTCVGALHVGTFLDPLWVVVYVLWGAAGLHPGLPAVTRVEPTARHPLTLRRIALLGAAVMLLPGLIVVEVALGIQPHTTAVSVAGVALVALVLVRMISLVRHMNDQAEHLERLASTDPVTGLPNARSFAARLRRHLRCVAAQEGRSDVDAVVLASVERVTEVTDILGLRTSEELLRAVGQRLVREAGPGAVVARLGGETFAVLLPDVSSARRALARATAIADAFTGPVHLPELTVTADAVVGLAVAPDDGRTADELLTRADVALSSGKQTGRRVSRYAEQDGGVHRAALMSELGSAIAAGDVVVHYQPQVELDTGTVLGVEALVRWQHPVHGLLPPSAFVPAAESAGLMQTLTGHVLDVALGQAAEWAAAGRPLAVSVNLSARNLLDPTFVDHVRCALRRHDVPPHRLDLEITETMAMVDPARAVEVLGRLAALGVTLSVDDYGTGYSSLAYLQRLPVHRLKIDRSFVAGVVDDSASAVIMRSTVELARHLGLVAVAEGVEDEAVLRALHSMGCFAAQGYGLGRPVPPEKVLALVERIEAETPATLHRVPHPRVAG